MKRVGFKVERKQTESKKVNVAVRQPLEETKPRILTSGVLYFNKSTSTWEYKLMESLHRELKSRRIHNIPLDVKTMKHDNTDVCDKVIWEQRIDGLKVLEHIWMYEVSPFHQKHVNNNTTIVGEYDIAVNKAFGTKMFDANEYAIPECVYNDVKDVINQYPVVIVTMCSRKPRYIFRLDNYKIIAESDGEWKDHFANDRRLNPSYTYFVITNASSRGMNPINANIDCVVVRQANVKIRKT